MSEQSVAAAIDVETVRARILEFCGTALEAYGVDLSALPTNLDLRACGAIDSLGFVELVADLEEGFGVELELEDMDPRELTMLEPLARTVAAQAQGTAG